MEVKNIISNDIAWAIERLQELYRNGNIRAVAFQVITKNGEIYTATAGTYSFIELIGMLETTKQDQFFKAVLDDE